MVAIALIHGTLTAHHYEEEAAKDTRIDFLRNKMTLKESKIYSIDYHDPEKRSIANAITIYFKDGSQLGPVEIQYPIGHRQRRKEGLPLLYQKLEANLLTHYSQEKVSQLMKIFTNYESLTKMRVNELLDLLGALPQDPTKG